MQSLTKMSAGRADAGRVYLAPLLRFVVCVLPPSSAVGIMLCCPAGTPEHCHHPVKPKVKLPTQCETCFTSVPRPPSTHHMHRAGVHFLHELLQSRELVCRSGISRRCRPCFRTGDLQVVG